MSLRLISDHNCGGNECGGGYHAENNNNANPDDINFQNHNIPHLVLVLLFVFTVIVVHTFSERFSRNHTSKLKDRLSAVSAFKPNLPVTQASSTAWSLLKPPPKRLLHFCFMPSAPPTTTTSANTQEPSQELPLTSNQHGTNPADLAPRPSLPGIGGEGCLPLVGERGYQSASMEPFQDHGPGALGEETAASDSGQPLTSRRSPASKGKPSQKKYLRPDPNGKTFITALPNEVLTHTLSFLDPVSLTSVSLVSRRFHSLVTSPHAWRDAFARYFPQHNTHAGPDTYPVNARYFTRLSNMGTHRSEYILRTQLLRSLKRGRPSVHPGVKPVSSQYASSNFSMITYNPKLHESTVTHLHADFAKNRVIAASQFTGLYSYSDPRTGYVEVEQRSHPGYSSFGLSYISQDGIGALDLSEPRGQLIGDAREGFPSFFVERASSNLAPLRFINEHGPGASVTCVWLAKKDTIVNTSGNRILSASGSSKGVVQFQSTTSQWMSFTLCPGIPILDIRIDDGYTKARERRNRVWCIVVNALGEVWYMKGKLPRKTLVLGRNMEEQPVSEFTPWFVVPSTKKPNGPVGIDILEPPGLKPSTEALLQQETWMSSDLEVMAVSHSEYWREDYFIEADFGGQNFIVGCKGIDDGPNTVKKHSQLRRFTRILDNVREEAISEVFIKNVYGRGYHTQVEELVPRPSDEVDPPDDWVETTYFIPQNSGTVFAQITACAIDQSNLALLSLNEDPLIARATSSSPAPAPKQVAGHLSRLFAVGTGTGTVHIYNARQPVSSDANSLPPLHTIATASPAISSLAISSLYLVHGGTDGLVQAWDPLVSITDPVRAIHSRFSTRARRRLAQAAISVHGIGENQFAARAIFLDPDPTQLRGIVALGTHIRSWSFSSTVERVSSNSNTRRRQRSGRDGNRIHSTGAAVRNRIGNSSKGPLRGEILDQADHLAGVRYEDQKRQDRLAQRFGVGSDAMAGLTEEEMVMYAMMMSEESFEREREVSEEATSGSSGGSVSAGGLRSIAEDGLEEDVWVFSESQSGGQGSDRSIISQSPMSQDGNWMDSRVNSPGVPGEQMGTIDDDEALAKALQETFDLEEAPRSPPSRNDIPIKFAKSKKKKGKGKQVALEDIAGPSVRSNSQNQDDQFDHDLELAIQLSMK